MEQEENESGVRAAYFPAPPPFWKDFTTENLARLEQLKQDADPTDAEHSDGASPPQLSASQILELPAELRRLIPPEPPADDDEYRVFNNPTRASDVDTFQTKIINLANALDGTLVAPGMLPGWKYEQLYPPPPEPDDAGAQAHWSQDRQQYLLRFVRSLLLNFLELLGILAEDPRSEDKDDKLKHMLNLVANTHALINEYRPHQARETLILTMQDQLDRKKAEVEGIRQMGEKVAATLADFAKSAPESRTVEALPRAAAASSAEEKRRESQRHMWRAMDELLSH